MLIFFEEPAVKAEDIGELVTLEATVVDFLRRSEKPLDVELTLDCSGRPKARHKMKGDGKRYSVKIPLVPKIEGPDCLKARVEYEDGELKGLLEPVVFKVKDKEIALDKVAEIMGGLKPEIILRKGREKYEINRETKLLLTFGPHKIDIELEKVKTVTVLPPPGVPAFVSYNIIVRRGGREVGRREGTISIEGGMVCVHEPGPVPIGRAEFEGAKVVKKCPGTISDIIAAAGGRFLICHFPKLRKLGVFDVVKLKFVKYISVNDDNVKFAAGREKLIIALSGSGIMQRWDLTTFQKEVTVAIPCSATLTLLSMGSNSAGPLLIGAQGKICESGASSGFMNIKTMKMIEGMKTPRGHNPPGRKGVHIRASADGSVFGIWCTSHSPNGVGTMVLEGGQVQCHYEHNSEGFVLPGPNGKYVYTCRNIYSRELKRIRVSGGEMLIPGTDGDYYIGISATNNDRRNKNKETQVRVYMSQDNQPLVTLSGIEIDRKNDGWARHDFTMDKRVWCIPSAGAIITVPHTNDRLVVHRFDPEGALEKSGIDYLIVTSRPPAGAAAGENFSYQINAKSKRGGVKFTLESGPEGMSLSESGGITWTIPADIEDDKVFIIVCISDSTGQEIYHNFDLKIIKPRD